MTQNSNILYLTTIRLPIQKARARAKEIVLTIPNSIETEDEEQFELEQIGKHIKLTKSCENKTTRKIRNNHGSHELSLPRWMARANDLFFIISISKGEIWLMRINNISIEIHPTLPQKLLESIDPGFRRN